MTERNKYDQSDKYRLISRAKRFFTLAEILITLAIIGAVAALSIPNLIVSFQKMTTVIRLQKIYTVLSNALTLSALDNGNYSEWKITSANWSDGQAEFNLYLKPYLSIAKYCGVKQWQGSGLINNCMPYIPKGKDGSTQTWQEVPSTFMVLNDGTIIDFLRGGDGTLGLFMIYVDINGVQGPNAFGRDIFNMVITTTDGLQPKFYETATRSALVTSCNNNVATSFSDSGCMALIIRDGWKISDDYTW